MTHRLLVEADAITVVHAYDCDGPCELSEYVIEHERRLLDLFPVGHHNVELVHERDADGEPYTALLPLWDPADLYPHYSDEQPKDGPLRGFPYQWRSYP